MDPTSWTIQVAAGCSISTVGHTDTWNLASLWHSLYVSPSVRLSICYGSFMDPPESVCTLAVDCRTNEMECNNCGCLLTLASLMMWIRMRMLGCESVLWVQQKPRASWTRDRGLLVAQSSCHEIYYRANLQQISQKTTTTTKTIKPNRTKPNQTTKTRFSLGTS